MQATHVVWPPEEWKRLEPRLPKRPNRRIETVGAHNIKIINEGVPRKERL